MYFSNIINVWVYNLSKKQFVLVEKKIRELCDKSFVWDYIESKETYSLFKFVSKSKTFSIFLYLHIIKLNTIA